MKSLFVSLIVMTCLSAFAKPAKLMTCTHISGDNAVSDDFQLKVISKNKIEVTPPNSEKGTKPVVLELDSSYEPKSTARAGFERFDGDTETATSWIESATIDFLLNSDTKEVIISFRSEVYDQDRFQCE